MSSKIFVVDDERTIRLTFRMALETDGYEVQEAASVDEAMMGFKTESHDLVTLDLRIGDNSGLQVLEKMRLAGVRTPTLMITAYGSIRDAVRAMKLGAIDFLEKPIDPNSLRRIVAEILSRHQSAAPNGQPPTFEDLIREAKRLINLQQFRLAEEKLTIALKLNERSAEAHNLCGVLHEIRGDFDAARRAYGRAIRVCGPYGPAQQNMRRLFELFNFGRSEEPLHFGYNK